MFLIFVSILCALHIQTSYGAISWAGDLANFPTSWNVKISNPELLSIVNDPLDSTVKVIKIKHPKGSCSSFCGIANGASFRMFPFANFKGQNATLEFSVFFHSTFDFVKGGKLPGLIGGTNQCSGCNTVISERDNCFSARFMVNILFRFYSKTIIMMLRHLFFQSGERTEMDILIYTCP